MSSKRFIECNNMGVNINIAKVIIITIFLLFQISDIVVGQEDLTAKEALLRACAPFCALGYPVRVKTGAERVHAAFMGCALLGYEGHRAAVEQPRVRGRVTFRSLLGASGAAVRRVKGCHEPHAAPRAQLPLLHHRGPLRRVLPAQQGDVES